MYSVGDRVALIKDHNKLYHNMSGNIQDAVRCAGMGASIKGIRSNGDIFSLVLDNGRQIDVLRGAIEQDTLQQIQRESQVY